MKAKVPASSANLGPGFDTLAVALQLYIEVEIEPASSFVVEVEGEGSDIPATADHLAAVVLREVLDHDNAKVRIKSDIPLSRGLGSSAALAVAVAAAAGADDPFEVATKIEGHPDNAGASFLGGLVAGGTFDNVPVATPLFLDPDISFVVAIPDSYLPTSQARRVLPKTVSLEDAVFNLSRLSWLIAGLADADILRAGAMDDRLHQNARHELFPEAREIMASMVEAGAVTSCWSGAGSSILGVATSEKEAQAAKDAAAKCLSDNGLGDRACVMLPDHCGLQLDV